MRARLPRPDVQLLWRAPRDGRHEAYSGEALVAIIREDGATIRYEPAGVDMATIRHAKGTAASVYAAKLKAQRAWASWLRRARLEPIVQATMEAGVPHSIRSR